MKCLAGLFVFCVLVFSTSLYANPNREFSVDQTTINSGGVVKFDASSINSAKKFIWTYGDDTTLTTTEPIVTHQYKDAGEFSASLSIQVNSSSKNPNYKNAGTVKIFVKPVVKPNQPPVAYLSCSTNNLLVTCNALSSYDPDNQPLTFTFKLDDGTEETNTTGFFSHAFQNPGTYTAHLSVMDIEGATSNVSVQILAVKPPNQLPSLALNCMSESINTLSCNSLGSVDADGSIGSYTFSWDDGKEDTFASSSDVRHVFSSGGVHTVTLSAIDNDGGISIISKSFEVKSNTPPIADFECDNASPLRLKCSSLSKETDVGDSIVSYSWSFNGTSSENTNQSNFEKNFSSGGTVSITLSILDSHGGSSEITKSFIIKENLLPTFDFNASVIKGVAPLEVNFKIFNMADADGSISNSNIQIENVQSLNGQEANYIFKNPGTYSVVASVTDDLGGITTKTIEITVEALVSSPPTAFFKVYQFDTWVDLRSFVTKTAYDIKRAFYTIDGDTIVDLPDFYPNSSVWVDLKTYERHEIKLTVEDVHGQVSYFTHGFDQINNTDLLKPYVDFKYQQSAINTAFFQMGRSFDFDSEKSITNFHFDFGDGTFADTKELYFTHQFPAAGTYLVKMTGVTSHNTQETKELEVTVTSDSLPSTKPVANFSYTIYDFAQNVSFYNEKSGTPNGTIISYVWDFGDGQMATGQKVAHFYDPGTYLVTLTVIDSSGASSSQTQKIIIYGTGSDLITEIRCDLEKPYFDFVQQCQVVALDKLNQISRVRVAWGDSTFSNLTLPSPNGIFKPSHKYTSEGTYNVTATTLTIRGEVKSATTQIKLTKYIPIVPSIQCETNNLLVFCNALGSYDASGGNLTYTFDYGDTFSETTTTGISSHAYKQTGLYIVKLTVTNSSGDSASAETTVMPTFAENVLPVAILNCYSTTNNTIRCSANQSYDNDGQIISAHFSFDDGTKESISPDQDIDHSFLTPGEHSVGLYVIDNDGAISSTVEIRIETKINNAPVASFSCQVLENKVSCNSLSSYDSDGEIAKSQWNFGDNSTAEGTFVEHTYNGFGQYLISLKVFDDHGDYSEYSQMVSITGMLPIPIATCELNSLSLTCDGSSSIDPDGTVVSYKWYIESEIIDGKFLNYTFFSSGEKNVFLEIKDDSGNSQVKNVGIFTIEPKPPVALFTCIKVSESVVDCDGSFSQSGMGKIVSYKWEADNREIFGATAQIHFSSVGEHPVILTVKNELGIESSLSTVIEVNSTEIESSSVASISIAEAQTFYPLSGSIVFQITDGALSGDYSENEIMINNESIEESLVVFTSQTVSLNNALSDGPNLISFKLKDTHGNFIKRDFKLYAGGRNVEISLKNSLGENINNATINGNFSQDGLFQLSVTEEKYVLKNVPNLDILLNATSTGNLGAIAVLTANEASKEIVFSPLNLELNNSNLDFSEGIGGWTVVGGDYSFEDGALRLTPGADGIATLFKRIEVTDAAAVAVNLSLGLASPNEDDLYQISLKNVTTGKNISLFSDAKGLVKSFSSDGEFLDVTKNLEVSGSNNIVEFRLTLFSKKVSPIVHNRFFLDSIISSSHAATNAGNITRITAEIRGLKIERNLAVTKTGLFDPYSLVMQRDLESISPRYNHKGISNYALSNLSVGKLPDYMNGQIQTNSEPIIKGNEIYAVLNFAGDITKMKSAQLVVKLSDDTIIYEAPAVLKNGKLYQQGVNNFVFHFSLKTNNWLTPEALTKSKYLKVLFKYSLLDGIEKSISLSSSNGPYLPLISLTPYGPFNFYYSRFIGSTRDYELGGDDWISPEYLDLYNKYLSHFSFTLAMRYNDFAKMNGGPHPEHSTHAGGNIFDGRVEGFTKGNVTKWINNEKVLESPIIDSETAERLIYMLNYLQFSSKVDHIYVTYASGSKFEERLKRECLSDGRMAIKMSTENGKFISTGVIDFRNNHADHFHVQVNNNRANGVRSTPSQYSVYGTGKFGHIKFYDQSSKKFIDNKNYIVVAKSQFYDSSKNIKENEWVTLKPINNEVFAFYDNNDFIVPISTVDSRSFIFKVIYTGESGKGCYETTELLGDISPQPYAISDEASLEAGSIDKYIVEGTAAIERKILIQLKDFFGSESTFESSFSTFLKDENGLYTQIKTNTKDPMIELPIPATGAYIPLLIKSFNPISNMTSTKTLNFRTSQNNVPNLTEVKILCSEIRLDRTLGASTNIKRAEFFIADDSFSIKASASDTNEEKLLGYLSFLEIANNKSFVMEYLFPMSSDFLIFSLEDNEKLKRTYRIDNPCIPGKIVPESSFLSAEYSIVFGQ